MLRQVEPARHDVAVPAVRVDPQVAEHGLAEAELETEVGGQAVDDHRESEGRDEAAGRATSGELQRGLPLSLVQTSLASLARRTCLTLRAWAATAMNRRKRQTAWKGANQYQGFLVPTWVMYETGNRNSAVRRRTGQPRRSHATIVRQSPARRKASDMAIMVALKAVGPM